MPQLYPYRLFVSHAWSYSDSYNRLIALLDNANNFLYHNYSVPKADPIELSNSARLTEKMRDQIRPVQVVIVIAGMYVNHSDWIQFEMDFAHSLGKPIVGVRPWGNERVPQAVQDCAMEMVNWNSESLVAAIRRVVP